MSEFEKKFVDQRLTDIKNGEYEPKIDGLPGIVFVNLDNKAKGVASRTYSKAFFEYLNEGLPSEALIPKLLKQSCEAAGLDIKVLNKKTDLTKKIYEESPGELQGPYDSLTEEEIAQLTPEERESRAKAIAERGKKIAEFMTNLWSPEEKELLEQITQIENIERSLRNNTAEFHARNEKMIVELLHGCRKAQDVQTPYFASKESILDLDRTNRQALVQLLLKWAQFREGRNPEFFRSDNPAQ